MQKKNKIYIYIIIIFPKCLHQILRPDGWQRARSCCESLQLSRHSPPLLSLRLCLWSNNKTAKKYSARSGEMALLARRNSVNQYSVLRMERISDLWSLSLSRLLCLSGRSICMREMEGSKLYGRWGKPSSFFLKGKATSTTDSPLSFSLPLYYYSLLVRTRNKNRTSPSVLK